MSIYSFSSYSSSSNATSIPVTTQLTETQPTEEDPLDFASLELPQDPPELQLSSPSPKPTKEHAENLLERLKKEPYLKALTTSAPGLSKAFAFRSLDNDFKVIYRFAHILPREGGSPISRFSTLEKETHFLDLREARDIISPFPELPEKATYRRFLISFPASATRTLSLLLCWGFLAKNDILPENRFDKNLVAQLKLFSTTVEERAAKGEINSFKASIWEEETLTFSGIFIAGTTQPKAVPAVLEEPEAPGDLERPAAHPSSSSKTSLKEAWNSGIALPSSRIKPISASSESKQAELPSSNPSSGSKNDSRHKTTPSRKRRERPQGT